MSTKRGRPRNEELLADGKIPVAKACKICNSGACDEITQMILNRATGRQIIEKFGHLFGDTGLTPTNIHSHKQHMNMDAAVKADRVKSIQANVVYSDTTKQLFQHKYNEDFDKMAAADTLYKQRLDNLFQLQREIEELNAKEKAQGTPLSDIDQGLRRKVIQDLEIAYRGFNQDLLKHIQLDADLYTKQVSLQYIELVKNSILRFTQKFMDVLVKEVADNATRIRVTEQLGDILDEQLAPALDPNKIVDAEFEEVTIK